MQFPDSPSGFKSVAALESIVSGESYRQRTNRRAVEHRISDYVMSVAKNRVRLGRVIHVDRHVEALMHNAKTKIENTVGLFWCGLVSGS